MSKAHKNSKDIAAGAEKENTAAGGFITIETGSVTGRK